jgi:hypothetical protein
MVTRVATIVPLISAGRDGVLPSPVPKPVANTLQKSAHAANWTPLSL